MPFSVLQGVRMELDKMYGQLCAMTAQMEELNARAMVIVRQHEKGEKIFDQMYEKDFSHVRLGMRGFANKMQDFYHFMYRSAKVIRLAPNIGSATSLLRSLALTTKHIKMELEKFSSVLRSAKNSFRKMPVTVYWWDLGKTLEELFKTMALMMALVQELNGIASEAEQAMLEESGESGTQQEGEKQEQQPSTETPPDTESPTQNSDEGLQ